MKKISLLLLTFLLSIAVLAACGDKDNDNAENNDNQEAEMPEPDLKGIPDVVAEVNGEKINKDDFEGMYQQQFQQSALQAQMSGEEIDQDELKKQTAEGMVGQELLIQEANDRFKDVSEDDVNDTVDDVVKQNGMESKDELLDAFKEQGMDEDEFMSQIETQVKVDKLIAEESGDTEPTKDEVKDAYETMKKQQEEADSDEEIPEYDDVKSDLKAQLQQQKEAEATQKYVDKLRKDADVTINI